MKIITTISLIAVVILIIYVMKLRRYIHEDAKGRQDLTIRNAHAKSKIFDSLPVSPSDTVLFGDSIIENFPVELLTGIKNRGIGGNTTHDILNRVGQVKNAGHIYLLVGVNDLREGLTVDSTFNNFKMIAEALKGKLTVHTLAPTSGRMVHLQPLIKEYNEKVKLYCKEQGIAVIDLYEVLSGKDYTYDGLHLNFEGYKRWQNLLLKLL